MPLNSCDKAADTRCPRCNRSGKVCYPVWLFPLFSLGLPQLICADPYTNVCLAQCATCPTPALPSDPEGYRWTYKWPWSTLAWLQLASVPNPWVQQVGAENPSSYSYRGLPALLSFSYWSQLSEHLPEPGRDYRLPPFVTPFGIVTDRFHK
jgi:hypothetical protein